MEEIYILECATLSIGGNMRNSLRTIHMDWEH